MIRQGRKVITATEVAERVGVPLRTWSRRDSPAFEQRVPNLWPGGSRRIYDLEQALAYLAGDPVPALPAAGHPDDLLTDHETGDLLGVSSSTVSAYRTQGYLTGRHPSGPDEEPITGIRVTSRREVEARRASLPHDHTPGKPGRPVGSAARDEAAALIKRGQAKTGEDLSEALGITPRHGARLLRELGAPSAADIRKSRQAQVRELLTRSEEKPTLQQVADELGISKTAAHRLVQAVQAQSEQ